LNRKKQGSEGPELTTEQLRLLALKAHANALELVDEAMLLFEHGHFARCVFLTQIAGEELGKCHLTMTSIPKLLLGKMHWSRFWQRFRSHKEKSFGVHFFEDFMSEYKMESLEKMTHIVSTLEAGKMRSLYSDQWQEEAIAPSDWVKKELAANLLSWARGRLSLFAARVVPMLDKTFMDEFTAADMHRHLREFVEAMGEKDQVLSEKLFNLMTDDRAM
jgi:AbiV family abortive infection protein